MTWGDAPAAWNEVLAAHPGDVERLPRCDETGQPTGAPQTVVVGPGNELGLGALVTDEPYLVRLTSACLASAECAAAASCCAGCCVAAPALGRPAKDGTDLILTWDWCVRAGYEVRRSLSIPPISRTLKCSPMSGPLFRDVGAWTSPKSYFDPVDEGSGEGKHQTRWK